MNPRPKIVAFLSLLLALSGVSPLWAADPAEGAPKRGNARFYHMHASFLERAAEGPVGLLFLGDSITEGWRKVPELWESAWGQYQPANFGIGGDQTQHVIWRIEDGELDKISPKVVVLMIGTNNTGGNTAEEITAANKKIVNLIREKLPETKVLLLAIFPRGPRTSGNGVVENGKDRMAKIDAINAEMAKWDDGERVFFLNINDVFLNDEGKIPDEIMPDQLHPNAKGYALWVEAMAPTVEKLMK